VVIWDWHWGECDAAHRRWGSALPLADESVTSDHRRAVVRTRDD
jgi:hypothetical protein